MLKRGPWNLSDLKDIPKNGYKVFSCFHCGGGSTMGYKLSGFEVVGGVEIDPEMMKVYRANHSPKHSFLMGVQDFNKIPRDKIPKDLFGIDVLDGSPPCSSFSMAGSREKAWGTKKKFREGQADQVLDDLFFHFIETARILQPKVVIAENVKGLLFGKAQGYIKQIVQMFGIAGYDVQLFMLNAAFMGVPQSRERTFFVARRRDLNMPKIALNFQETTITVAEAWDDLKEKGQDVSSSSMVKYWRKIKPGEAMSKVHEKGSLFGQVKLNPNKPAPTVTSKTYQLWDWRSPNLLTAAQVSRLQSFPDDYEFLDQEAKYLCGMSVPPFMMNRVSHEVKVQLLDVISQRSVKSE